MGLARDLPELAATEPVDTARLLPAFDPWVVGASRTSPAVLDPRHKARVFRPQGWFSPVLLVNGRMVGVWKHTRKGRRLLVELEPFGRLPAWARGQLESEAERWLTSSAATRSRAGAPRLSSMLARYCAAKRFGAWISQASSSRS